MSSWRALATLHSDGRVRAIGVSNFLPEHLDRIVDLGGVVSAVNQIKLHPALQQREIEAANQRLGIATRAWSPLARAAVLTDPAVTGIDGGTRPHRRPGRPPLSPPAGPHTTPAHW
ncbi:aldo/keto reductase [Micromonospora krabiensis]|uniref:aldo/keto reductase n=1 Tax=Micromonospora krabiensis TaxID=307121 RepID=UPI000ACCB0F2|nr:aldo/keto reductase [Micromonospora krabiensis]